MDDHRTSELLLANIVDSVNDAIVSLDEGLRILFLNRVAESIFGCTGETLVGQCVDKCKSLSDVIAQLNLTELTPAVGQMKAMRYFEGRRGDGEIFHIEAAVAGARIKGRLYFTAIIRDVSRENKMERALYHFQKTQVVALLARGIAHDFNNILAAILGHLDLVVLATDLSASLRKTVHYAQTAARRGAELVNRLVTFSRESETKSAPLDLDTFVAEVVFVLRRSFDRRIKIEHFQDSSPKWLVHADVNQIMQVLLALCLHARDLMPNGGELSIRVARARFSSGESAPHRKTGDFVRLTISNTGESLPQEVVNRLFEPSFAGSDLGKRVGFGLSIAQSMIVAFGGWIEMESLSGRGTQFDVYLPRLLPEDLNSEGTIGAAPEPRSLDGHEAILLIEHEESLRVMLRSILEYRGYRIVTVATREEAIEQYVQAKARFDLVLMDLDLPSSGGWEVVAKIEQHDPVAIILLSASGAEKERAVGSGTHVFLAKPFQNDALVSIVRQTLDRFRKAQKANIPNPSTNHE